MNAVGRLGSYISRSVYVVSGPFHPFGGAVDIIVVEQPDGSFKSSPWYVRFGKFQGVLKANDKIVSVIVNGVEADFHMYLDPKGEAHFIREVDAEDGDIISVSPLSSSGEDTDGQSHIRRPIKSKSWNFDSHECETATQIDASDGGIVGRTNSRRSRILGFVMGRRSVRENSFLEGKNDCFETKESLESAEMAADLMELKWSRSLVSSRRNKDGMKGLSTGVQDNGDLVKNEMVVDNLDKSSQLQQNDSLYYEMDDLSSTLPTESTESAKESEMDIPCLVSTYVTGTSPVEGNNKPVFEMLLGNEILCVSDGGECINSVDAKFEAFSTEQDLQTTDITFQDKCQSDIGSTSMDSTCGMVNEKNLECDGVPLDHVENEFITEPFSDRVLFQPVLEKTKSEDGKMDVQVSPLDTIDCPIRLCLHGSESSDELFFGELDDMKGIDRIPHHQERECELLVSQIRNEENKESSIGNDVSRLSPEKSCIDESATIDIDMKLKSASSDLNIHEKSCSEVEEVSRIAISLPNMSLHDSDLNDCRDSHTRLQDGVLIERKSEADKGSECINVGPSSPPLDASPKSWKSWSFSSDRNSDAQNVLKKDGTDDERVPILKATKKNIRTTTPTTEELKSLNLKEGTNIVEFTFSTPMLGRQQVEARIHLWKWDSRIVISDVDGTITRSDVLGQVMPLVGVDWSQTGVAHLFSAIKENGYHVLFLSARAISQAYSTRQFLCNLKQDGKALPEGPVVISPDGLFPSLYREVVRRAPHEFKISCLEAIKALFPPDRNPFYAGFGNRDTDEISYFKVGIPRGKIFIINPKGEIVVNRRVDRKSYTSLHALVDDMFPLMSSSEQEDFNSWNYWKLPLPSTDI